MKAIVGRKMKNDAITTYTSARPPYTITLSISEVSPPLNRSSNTVYAIHKGIIGSAIPATNWISFDFGETKKIDTVVLAFYNGNARATIFDVEISDDGENWTQVFSGQSSGTTNKYEYFPIGDRTARYLRIVGKGTSTNEQWLSILEFRAFGRK